tara:strand:+ start:532 stop:819 length:288 start_codon:yes stop_codon:yes gene_type:complete
MKEDFRYIKANPEFNKKLNELIQMQKSISKEQEAEWDFDFEQDSKDTGLDQEDVRLFVTILGELIFHSVANGAQLSKDELRKLTLLKFNQVRKGE